MRGDAQARVGRLDLRDILYPTADKVKEAEELLIQTRITQPAFSPSSTRWPSYGCPGECNPRAMTGHSVGEYVAGCLAGVFSLEEALGLVAGRAKLVQSQPAAP